MSHVEAESTVVSVALEVFHGVHLLLQVQYNKPKQKKKEKKPTDFSLQQVGSSVYS